MTSRDDMVITPQLAGTDREAASRSVDGRIGGRPGRGAAQRGGLIRRVTTSRGIQRARVARATRAGGAVRGGGRLLARAGPIAAAAVITAVIVKIISGMTFEQMSEAGAKVFFGEKAMEARATAAASARYIGTRNMRGYHLETERAERTGTINRAAVDASVVHKRMMVHAMEREHGNRDFILDDQFRVESVPDLLIDQAKDGAQTLVHAFRDWARGR